MPERKMTLDSELAVEAKALVALAFRNGPHRGCSRWQKVPYLRWEIRILAHNAS